MNHHPVLRICILLTTILLLGTASASAQTSQPAVPQAPAANANSRITFQGMLKENGVPVTGSRNMIFRLYSDATCATQAGGDISKPGVKIAQGLFSVPLDLVGVNGQALWLQVTVGSTALGCQEITAAPYALSLLPGASTRGVVPNGSAFLAANTAGSGVSYGVKGQADSNYTGATGVYGFATASTGYTRGMTGEVASNGGTGVYGQADSPSGTTYGVWGQSASTSGTGAKGYSTATSGTTYGVWGQSASTGGTGVKGWASSTSGATFGMSGQADSINGTGVKGRATATSGVTFGMSGQADSTSGTGVQGYASAASGATYGVWGQADSINGTGVKGWADSTSGATFGMWGQSASTSGTGVLGYATASTGNTNGVYGWAQSPSGYGGYFTSLGHGLLAQSTGSGVAGIFQSNGSPANPTVRLVENGAGAARLDFTNSATKNTWSMAGNPGAGTFSVTYGDGDLSLSVLSASSSGGVDIAGSVTLHNPETGKATLVLGQGQDVAEGFDVTQDEKLPAGSVLVIDPENPGQLMLSTSAYDGRVAGVIAGANGLDSGVKLGAGSFDYSVALSGRVYALVDATDAAVQPGDLLTTSSLPGYAMKAGDLLKSQGAILGKAMQPLAKGQRGLVLILVTLQ